MLHYLVALLKQTTELKTPPIANVTQFHNIRPVMSQTVSYSRGSFSSTNHSILHSWRRNVIQYSWVSPGTFHSLVSTITPTLRTHTLTTVHATQSHNSAASLTKTSVCVCLENINTEPIQQVGVLYTESYGLVSGFEHLYIVTWSEKKLVNNYTFPNFPRNFSLFFVVKLFWKLERGCEKGWILKKCVSIEAKRR